MNRLHDYSGLSNISLKKVFRFQKTYRRPNSYLNNKNPYEIIEIFKQLTPKYQVIAKYILGLFETFPWVALNQSVIAFDTKTSLSSTKRCIKRLRELDLLHVTYSYKANHYNETNEYRINEAINRYDVKYSLKCFFRNVSFVVFTVANLLPTAKSLMESDTLLILSDSYLIKKQSSRECPLTHDARAREACRTDLSCKLKKGDEVNKDSLTLIENNLDKLPLTTRGILKLAVYPVKTIEHILSKRLNLDAGNLFSDICANARKETDPSIVVDFSIYDKTCRVMSLDNEPYIDADKLQELKQQQQSSQQSYKPKPLSYNNKQTTSSIKTVVNPTPYPSTNSFFEKIKNKAIAQGIYEEGMSFGDVQNALRLNYEYTLTD